MHCFFSAFSDTTQILQINTLIWSLESATNKCLPYIQNLTDDLNSHFCVSALIQVDK